MEKIVSNGDRDCTVILDGTECSVKFDRCFRAFSVQNNSTSDVFVSIHQGANAGDDGVMRIKSGASACYPHMRTDVDTVYLNGTGEIQVHGQNTDNNSFRNAPVSSGGGGSEVDAYSKTESDARYPLKTDTVPRGLGFGYGICNSAAVTVSKSANVLGTDSPQWKRVDHSIVAIRFAAAVPANATLTINYRGSCPIYYHGVKITDGIIGAGDTVTFIYINDIYHVIGIENGGKANSADTLTDWGTRTIANANDAPFGFCAALDCENAPNTFWSTILTTGSSGAAKYKTQIAFPWAFGADENRIRYRCESNGEWSGWQEISTTPIKSTTFSGTTDAYSNMSFWAKSENKIPILFECEDKNAAIFYGKNGYFYAYVTDNLHQNVVETAVSGTVWYVEV